MTGGVAVILQRPAATSPRECRAALRSSTIRKISCCRTAILKWSNSKKSSRRATSPSSESSLKIIIVTPVEQAERILNDWDTSVRQFTKVMPIDYKRALAELAQIGRRRWRSRAHQEPEEVIVSRGGQK